MAIILLIRTEDAKITELPLEGEVILGRSSSCSFKILDTKMSGNHGSFNLNAEGQLIFKDLGSTNGSFINNVKTQQTVVKVHDIIRMGNTLVRIDEKSLTIPEKKRLGIKDEDKKVKDPTALVNSTIEEAKQAQSKKDQLKNEAEKKKGVVLSKKLKEKKKEDKDIWLGGSETIIDQDISSGLTRMIKLDTKKKKKSK